jgi:hypothetical protein
MDRTMNIALKGVAKRLIFAAATASALGGCAVYEPGYYDGYAGPSYSGPYYAGPPVSLGFWFDERQGGHGHGGHRGHWGGRHR